MSTDALRVLHALRKRGATRLQTVRFRANRFRYLSVTQNGRSLNLDAVFREAPAEVLDAIACLLSSSKGSEARRSCEPPIAAWAERREADPSACAPRVECAGTSQQQRFLRALYRSANRLRFANRLPAEIPLRLSRKMKRRLGHYQAVTLANGSRGVVEIALNLDLFLPGNEAQLVDTLLHEMAHADCWLRFGDHSHRRLWRAIARRAGAEPRAVTRSRVLSRSERAAPVHAVPDPLWLRLRDPSASASR